MRVALTLDAEHPDAPCADGNAERVLEVLDDGGVRASFFLQGRWAASHPALARRIAAAGHTVGNHSKSHAPIDLLTDPGIEASVGEAAEMIVTACGVDPRPWFRCPYGDGGDDPRVLAVLERLGYRHVGWDVDVADWQADRDPAQMADDLVDAVVRHGDGAVVLLHTWPDATAAALPAMIERLAAAGAEWIGVEQRG
jgi:peptidoglycan/xylan/chitin deacetylase (PgdA/CDA1 family)